jgi:hypothetical protein
MLLMSPQELDSYIQRYRQSMLLGALLIALALLTGRGNVPGFGIVCGTMAVGLGAMGPVFAAWRSERGLWMLSLLFLVPSVALYAVFEYEDVKSLAAGPRRLSGILEVLDFVVAAWLLWRQSRFLYSITRCNYHVR